MSNLIACPIEDLELSSFEKELLMEWDHPNQNIYVEDLVEQVAVKRYARTYNRIIDQAKAKGVQVILKPRAQ